MLAGGRVSVNVNTFQNDLSVIISKDKALTALIHLGYLGYNADMEEAYIPDYEVRLAYQSALSTEPCTDMILIPRADYPYGQSAFQYNFA